MKVPTKLFIVVAPLFMLAAYTKSQDTQDFIQVHAILSSPGGEFTFADGRIIVAKQYNVGGCGSWSTLTTGSSYPNAAANNTIMSYDHGGTLSNCLVEQSGGNKIYNSIQVIKVTTSGWAMTPQEINLLDIDSQVDVKAGEEWRDSAAVFGLRSGNVVTPTVQLSSNTLLQVSEYTFPASVFSAIEVSHGDAIIQGAEFAPPDPDTQVNCPLDLTSSAARQCQTKNMFQSPVDTLIFVYGATQTSSSDSVAAIVFSEILTPGGCFCGPKPGARDPVMVPVSITDGQGICEEQTSLGEAYACDISGSEWCEVVEVVGYTKDGPCEGIDQTVCPCTETTASKTLRIMTFVAAGSGSSSDEF